MFSLSEAIATKFLVMKPTMMIGGKHIEVRIRRGYKPCMCYAYTKVVLASLVCVDIASEHENKSLSMGRKVVRLT
jgi:hypothetical protein